MLGPAFVCGIMDGEVFNNQEDDTADEVFVIA
jgi:hypothetical protein